MTDISSFNPVHSNTANISINAKTRKTEPYLVNQEWLFFVADALSSGSPLMASVSKILSSLLKIPPSSLSASTLHNSSDAIFQNNNPIIPIILVKCYFEYYKVYMKDDEDYQSRLNETEAVLSSNIMSALLNYKASFISTALAQSFKSTSKPTEILDIFHCNIAKSPVYRYEISEDCFKDKEEQHCLMFNLFNDCKKLQCQFKHACIACGDNHSLFNEACRGSNNNNTIKTRLTKSNAYRKNLNNKRFNNRSNFNNYASFNNYRRYPQQRMFNNRQNFNPMQYVNAQNDPPQNDQSQNMQMYPMIMPYFPMQTKKGKNK